MGEPRGPSKLKKHGFPSVKQRFLKILLFVPVRPEAPFWKPNGSRNGAKTEAKTDEGNDRNFLTNNAPKRPQKGAPKWPRRHPKREQKPTPKRERKNTLKNKPVTARNGKRVDNLRVVEARTKTIQKSKCGRRRTRTDYKRQWKTLQRRKHNTEELRAREQTKTTS